jgi:putative transcriptional regulator
MIRLPSEHTEAKVARRGFCRDLNGALCALAALLGLFHPAFSDETKRLTSILIVARAELPDSHFSDSVVLVMNNLAPGPVGVIINRPTDIPVSQLFPDLKRLAQLHDKLYFGGPVDLESVWFLIRAAAPPEHAIEACKGVYLSANKDLLLKLLGRDKPMDGLKIFVGHSGWAPGQLEAEIDHGDWTARQADSDAIFKSQPEHPWPSPEAQAGHRT